MGVGRAASLVGFAHFARVGLSAPSLASRFALASGSATIPLATFALNEGFFFESS
jgi:hypothetical protein